MRKKVRFGRFQFAQRLALLRFVFCDAGRFFENRAPIFRTRAQDQVDLALFHHRVGAAPHSGVGEQILNVAQAAGRFVQEIFGVSVAINAPRHANVVPIDSEIVRAITQGQRDFGEA